MSIARLGGARRRDGVPPATPSLAAPEAEGGAILTHLVDFLDACMWQADPTTLEFTFVTKGVSELLGLSESSWLGEPDAWGAFVHAEDMQRVVDELRATATDGRDREIEFRAIDSDGRTRVLRHAVRLLEPPSGAAELWGVTTDLTADRESTEMVRKTKARFRQLSAEANEYRHRAQTDPLTGLANRVLFEDRLAEALRESSRAEEPCSVLLMDLNDFKMINDTHGHKAGDIVLKNAALRFRICLRDQDTPARFGGDEFAAVLPGTDAAGAACLAERIVRIFSDPIEFGDTTWQVGTSIGVATFPEHGVDAETLLARADAAMYHAKSDGGGVRVAEACTEMPRRTKRPRMRRGLIALAASLAIAAAGLTPVALQHARQRGPAARLSAAAVALQTASSDEANAAVDGVERELEALSPNDVSVNDVANALAQLKKVLHELDPALREALGPRVDALLATIAEAERVATLPSAHPSVVVPSMVPTPARPLPTLASPKPSPAATPINIAELL